MSINLECIGSFNPSHFHMNDMKILWTKKVYLSYPPCLVMIITYVHNKEPDYFWSVCIWMWHKQNGSAHWNQNDLFPVELRMSGINAVGKCQIIPIQKPLGNMFDSKPIGFTWNCICLRFSLTCCKRWIKPINNFSVWI